MCVAAIGLEDVAALQLAQPSLGKMAVKEPAQPFCVTFAVNDWGRGPNSCEATTLSQVLTEERLLI